MRENLTLTVLEILRREKANGRPNVQRADILGELKTQQGIVLDRRQVGAVMQNLRRRGYVIETEVNYRTREANYELLSEPRGDEDE